MRLESDPDRPRVTGATFVTTAIAEGRVHVQVSGEGFLARAAPLVARLGDQAVRRVTLRADGRGFTGMLAQPPREGDRLFVGYAGEELERTDVVYPGGGPAPRTA